MEKILACCCTFVGDFLHLVLYGKYHHTRGRRGPAGGLLHPTHGLAKGDGGPGGHPRICRALEPAPLLSVAPAVGNGTIGRFWFRTRENGNVHRVFITGFHTITFDNRPYYTPVDLSQWFPELYHSLEDVPEEPFSYPN